MTTEENKTIVRRLLEDGFNAGNTSLFDEMLTRDFANHDPSQPAVADREGLKQYWASLRGGFPDQHTVIDDLIAEGNQVVKRATWHGTHTGEFTGLPPTGRAVTLKVISIYRIAGSKVQEIYWGYDSLTLLQQLGVVPIPEHVGV